MLEKCVWLDFALVLARMIPRYAGGALGRWNLRAWRCRLGDSGQGDTYRVITGLEMDPWGWRVIVWGVLLFDVVFGVLLGNWDWLSGIG